MPIIFGTAASTVDEIVAAFERHGDRVCGMYRARYGFSHGMRDPYMTPRLERPESLAGNPPDIVYPWEQVFVAAAACVGSDYPMLAAHLGIPLERVELVIEGLFDPRGEFDGLAGFRAPLEARHCYRALHVRAAIVSSAAPDAIATLHARVLSFNMVLGALRGIPQTSELVIQPITSVADAAEEARR
jgi:hypothetical protein